MHGLRVLAAARRGAVHLDMAALYPRWSNRIVWVVLIGGLVLACCLVLAPMIFVRTPYHTGQFGPVEQPVQFDHRHHVVDAEIDCVYCHGHAESSPAAGVPTAELCMGCHTQIWNDSPLLSRVRRAYYERKPIRWQRVNQLADFAYFHHGVHVQADVPCQRCHGPVRTMAQVYQHAPLSMEWCLECHRDANAGTTPSGSGEQVAVALGLDSASPAPLRRELTRLTTCTACHR